MTQAVSVLTIILAYRVGGSLFTLRILRPCVPKITIILWFDLYGISSFTPFASRFVAVRLRQTDRIELARASYIVSCPVKSPTGHEKMIKLDSSIHYQ